MASLQGNGLPTACWLEDADRRSGIFFELCGRPDWASNKVAAAVRTGTMKPGFHTVAAKGALVGANHGFMRIRREFPVAALAIRAQLKQSHLTERD